MSVIAINYYKRIKAGLLTDISKVPPRWRSQVEDLINSESK